MMHYMHEGVQLTFDEYTRIMWPTWVTDNEKQLIVIRESIMKWAKEYQREQQQKREEKEHKELWSQCDW